MELNLSKEESPFNFSKDSTLKKVRVSCGWKESTGTSLDLDVGVVVRTTNNKHIKTVYYQNLIYGDTVKHYGDNIIGSDGDNVDETVDINLINTNETYHIFINIFNAINKRQSFDEVSKGFIHFTNSDTNEQLVRFNFKDSKVKKSNNVLLGSIEFTNGKWEFKPVGEYFYDLEINSAAHLNKYFRTIKTKNGTQTEQTLWSKITNFFN